ncbi:hypothetical protein ACJIZ3_017754 [Penstemon smallii]|uniref:Embryonic stem cell-specific 5-hydroxymethylcytosine-binding protein n=1 Tax=Penstemon smallii TaxID=265156 RepID=A0ABD3SXR2_9LAMI
MCGRARCTLRPDDFPRACNLNSRPVRHVDVDRYRPSYNVAPGFNLPVVRIEDGKDSEDGVVLHSMKWGLIPSFTKKTEKPDHFRMFNARSESIREKASFRRLLPNNRCLVSVEGFYEWKKDGSKKQPYYIHFKDDRPLVFAALFDSWKNSEGGIIYTFTIVTTASSSSLEWLHDRMPVILGNKESTDRWLVDSSLSNLDQILKPYEETDLVWYPVTPAMGKLSFDGSECIKEIQVKKEETKSISHFFKKKEAHGQKEPKPENTTIKEEPLEASQQENVKDDDESESKLNSTITEEEAVEASEPESAKEEQKSQDDSNARKGENDIKSENISSSPKGAHDIEVKRDFEEFSADSKPFAKETGTQHSSPVRKRSKGTTDNKQPTLFSYFGKR